MVRIVEVSSSLLAAPGAAKVADVISFLPEFLLGRGSLVAAGLARALLALLTGSENGVRPRFVPRLHGFLHKNPQILSRSGKRAANRPGIFRPWRRSFPFDFGDRCCPGGCSAMA